MVMYRRLRRSGREHLRTQNALSESNSRLQSIVEGTGVFAWEFCVEEDRFRYVSFEDQRLGYPRDRWLQPGFWDTLLHPEDREATTCQCLGEIQAGRAHRLNYRMIDAAGAVVQISDYVSEPERIDGRTIVRGVAVDVTDRKLAEQRTIENERRLRTIIEDADVIVWEFDPASNRFTFISDQAAKLGYDLRDWYTPGFWPNTIHPEDRARVVEQCAHETKAGRTHRLHYRMLRADGGVAWVEDVVTVEMSDGKPVMLRGIITDITAQVLQRAAIREQAERLDLTVRSANVGTWDWDIVTSHVVFNDVAQTMLGYQSGEWSPSLEQWKSVVHPSDLAYAMDLLDQHMKGLTPEFRAEYRMRRKDGSYAWILDVGRVTERDPHGEPLRAMGVHVDVTANKNYQCELQSVTESLQEAQSVGRIGSWSYDLATGNVSWTRQLFVLFGRNETDGAPDYPGVLSDYDPESAARLDAAVQAAIRDGTPYSLVMKTSSPRAAARYVRGEGRARLDDSGRIIALFGTASDVTAEIESTQALNIARAQAEAASKAKSEFLANMSHEIRTPLTAILGYTDILREDVSTLETDQRLHALDTMRNAGSHLLTIINDLLDLSKIEAQMMQVDCVETSLVGLLHEVASILRPRATGKGVCLIVELATSIPSTILSDPTRVRQILMNVVGNAVKFTEAGTVRIRAGVDSAAEPGRSAINIDVIDTGPGIPTDDADRLFSPFVQSDSTVTRRHGGTGLGLTISKRLSELIGGEVSLLTTTIGVGSTFRIRLPLTPTSNTQWIDRLDAIVGSDQGPEDRSEHQLRGRILLAEDGIDNQRLIAHFLRRAGATVDVAGHGQNALDMIEVATRADRPYDLIVTDIQMPVMDGYELTRRIRSAGKVIPIIALTAHAMPEDRIRCLSVGCNDYSVKPIDRASLIETCAKWLGQNAETSAAGPATANHLPTTGR
ncbi:MAG: PAS domain-containing protein [Phycisphaerales bacterium]|nr:PAS domain-containing protein [Phycisphaerales bacterium]